jgi:hypothetical protein
MATCRDVHPRSDIRPVRTWLDKTSSEIPCRVIELPELEVIPVDKPANNGEALLVRDAFKDVVIAKG